MPAILAPSTIPNDVKGLPVTLPSDLEIARAAQLKPLDEIAREAGLNPEKIIPYGHHVAKVPPAAITEEGQKTRGKYVVVTAVTPTPLGEGKTTTAVGLAQGLAKRGKRATLALRQPSMGPTFGIKGGAAGGGYSQVVPMEDLNLHLTGDFHAVTAAHNLLAAMIDNHLHHGNTLGIDPRAISWPRVLDVNDRSLRNIVIGLGARGDGVTRQTSFDITAASEIMVILSLASDLQDLRARLGKIVIGYTYDGEAVTAEDLKAAGAMAVILREAIHPNLLQTTENTPVLIHAGPFGNIATGNSSVVADRIGIHMGDVLLTEAGFGADMGAERFFNVKCRFSGLTPDAAVLVVTVRALKTHSGRHKVVPGKPLPEAMLEENIDDVRAGAANLVKHIEIVRSFGVAPVVAINVFPTDHDAELAEIEKIAREAGAKVARSTHVVDGGEGAVELADALMKALDEFDVNFTMLYEDSDPLEEKIEKIAKDVYGADGVDFSRLAKRDLAKFTDLGYGNLPIVMAKTHLSLSADPKLTGAPTGWRLPVRSVRLAAGAGYVYAICGDMRTMPGLSSSPAAERIDITDDGEIVGLS